MTPITYVTGDATAPVDAGRCIIAHVCNDIGGWGAGFVLAVSRRWPQPEQEYRRWYAGRDTNDFGLGAVQLVQVGPELWVANMVSQHGVRHTEGKPPIRYEALETCLARLAEHARALGASIHMPRIGTGLAGGRWEDVAAIVERTLCASDVRAVVYELPSSKG